MPQESFVQVDEGTGKKLRTYQRTVGANVVESSHVLIDDPGLPTFVAIYGGISTATNNLHLAQLMAGAAKRLYIRRIRTMQRAGATTASAIVMQILRLTSAGTGGAAVTPRPFDPTDIVSASAMGAVVTPGAEGSEIGRITMQMMSAAPVSNTVWEQLPNSKALIVPAGTANGLAIKQTGGAIAAGTLDIVIEFSEADY